MPHTAWIVRISSLDRGVKRPRPALGESTSLGTCRDALGITSDSTNAAVAIEEAEEAHTTLEASLTSLCFRHMNALARSSEEFLFPWCLDVNLELLRWAVMTRAAISEGESGSTALELLSPGRREGAITAPDGFTNSGGGPSAGASPSPLAADEENGTSARAPTEIAPPWVKETRQGLPIEEANRAGPLPLVSNSSP